MSKGKKKREPGLPPRVPDDLDELAEATTLLGNLAKTGEMRASRVARLVELIGALPTSPAQNAAWKSALKGYRREMYELEHRR